MAANPVDWVPLAKTELKDDDKVQNIVKGMKTAKMIHKTLLGKEKHEPLNSSEIWLKDQAKDLISAVARYKSRRVELSKGREIKAHKSYHGNVPAVFLYTKVSSNLAIAQPHPPIPPPPPLPITYDQFLVDGGHNIILPLNGGRHPMAPPPVPELSHSDADVECDFGDIIEPDESYEEMEAREQHQESGNLTRPNEATENVWLVYDKSGQPPEWPGTCAPGNMFGYEVVHGADTMWLP